jgi:diacylglycerol kinase (ATP)
LKLLIIFNPKAAFGRSVRKLEKIRARLDALGIQAEIKQTKAPGDGIELVAETDLAPFDGVIAAGGDGTLFEVLNGIYRHAATDRVPLGVLPIGTGNAFARDLGLQPSDWLRAIDIVHQRYTRKVDVGHVTSSDDDYYFLNIVSMGFAIDAGLIAKKLKIIGNTAYTVATLWQVLKLRSYPLHIDFDGDQVRQNNLFVTVSNTRYTGTHFLIAPTALTDDGLLDVTLLETLSRGRLLKLFPSIYKGAHINYPEVSVHQAKKVTIHSPGSMLLGPDGEFRGRTPAEIICLRHDLTIFSPRPHNE